MQNSSLWTNRHVPIAVRLYPGGQLSHVRVEGFHTLHVLGGTRQTPPNNSNPSRQAGQLSWLPFGQFEKIQV